MKHINSIGIYTLPWLGRVEGTLVENCGLNSVWIKKSMFMRTSISAPKRFAKFEWQTRTFCLKKKWKKAVAKLESDRLMMGGQGLVSSPMNYDSRIPTKTKSGAF